MTTWDGSSCTTQAITSFFFQDTNSAEEFLAIVGMLRNEKPLWFEDTRNQLRTGLGAGTREPVGEEET